MREFLRAVDFMVLVPFLETSVRDSVDSEDGTGVRPQRRIGVNDDLTLVIDAEDMSFDHDDEADSATLLGDLDQTVATSGEPLLPERLAEGRGTGADREPFPDAVDHILDRVEVAVQVINLEHLSDPEGADVLVRVVQHVTVSLLPECFPAECGDCDWLAHGSQYTL